MIKYSWKKNQLMKSLRGYVSNNKTKITLERAYDIIKKPITTEKSTNLQQFNQYSFIVLKNSNSL